VAWQAEDSRYSLLALALKVAVVRWWHGLGRFLPLIGAAVFLLMALTWASSPAGSSSIADMDERRRQLVQLLGSLLVGVAIVAAVIVAVTAQLGPTGVAELEAREDARDARNDAREERLEELQERVEELHERLEEQQEDGG
jgi:Kef-type K+ transport system membrane component KefB